MTTINLNKIRKDKALADAKARADTNAVKFGQTKAQRVLAAAQQTQSSNRLAQLKFEDE